MNTESIQAVEKAMTASDSAVVEPVVTATDVSANAEAEVVEDVVQDADGDGQENDGNSASPDGEDAPARQNKGVGKRINELTRKQKDAERRAEEAERQLAEIRQAAARNEQPGAQPKVQEGKPTREQFNYDEDAYVDAVVSWQLQQRDAQAAQRHAEEEGLKRARALQEAEDAFTDEHPDYMESISRLMVTEHMRGALMEAEMGPALAYHLAKNPDLAEEIRNKSPYAQVVAIGKLAAQFAAPAAATQTPARPAPPVQIPPPPPAPTLSARAPAASPPEKWDMNQHIEAIRAKSRR